MHYDATEADLTLCLLVSDPGCCLVPNMLVCWWQSWPLQGINYRGLPGVDCLKNGSDNKSNSEINFLPHSFVNCAKINALFFLLSLGA